MPFSLANLPDRDASYRIVLDTNCALDAFVFNDERINRYLADAMCGRVILLTSEACYKTPAQPRLPA